MTIAEMHMTFRELGQQMGMQTTRAILSEDIDICLNAAIIAKCRTIIKLNVGLQFSDKIVRQNASISPVNALRTLYTKADIDEANISGDGSDFNPFATDINNDGVMLFTGFTLTYNGKNTYDCRIVEYEKLGQTLNDFCNRATKTNPVVCITGDKPSVNVKVYTGNENPVKPKTLRYIYIKEPAKVLYDEEDGGNNVDCDLPDYLHMEIVEDAIKYYLSSISASSSKTSNN